jgi:hypothetical protein
MGLEPLFRFHNAWTSFAPSFGLHLFEGRLTIADMDRMEELGMAWRMRNPGRLVEMVVIFPSSARLDDEERKRLVRLIGNREKDRAASATVILADGLMGAVQRSMLTALMLMRRPPHPARVFATVTEGAEWLAPQHAALRGRGTGALDIVSEAEAMCESFRSRSADGAASTPSRRTNQPKST